MERNYQTCGESKTMKKVLAIILSIMFIVSLLAACGSSGSAQSSSAQSNQPGEAADVSDNSAESVIEDTSGSHEEQTPAEPAVAVEFDSHPYPSMDNQDYYVGLLYATNSSDKVVEAAFTYHVYDADGNAIQAYDQWNDRYSEEFSASVYIPANVEDFPIGFTLASGLVYDMKKNEELPAADRVEYEFTESREVTIDNMSAHFTPGEFYISNDHLYYPIIIDEEISGSCTTVRGNYTILGYSGGEVAAVCCRNDLPGSTSSWSVDYAKENNDGALLAYHDTPYGVTVDNWEIYLGCFDAE